MLFIIMKLRSRDCWYAKIIIGIKEILFNFFLNTIAPHSKVLYTYFSELWTLINKGLLSILKLI